MPAALTMPRVHGARWDLRLRKLVLECGAHPCRRFTVTHRLLRRDGISFDDAWYCSAECLQDALGRRLRVAARGCVEPLRRPGRLPFRLILVDRGVLREAQLREALRLQAEQGGSLEEILLAHGLATEIQIASAKAAEHGCPVMTCLPSVRPCFDLPRGLIERYKARVVYSSDACLLIGFVTRVAPVLLQAVEAIAGRRAACCFIAADALHSRGAQAGAGDALLEAEMAPLVSADAARFLVQRAMDTGAERVRMATGNQWAWIRLSRGERLEDSIDVSLPLSPDESRIARA